MSTFPPLLLNPARLQDVSGAKLIRHCGQTAFWLEQGHELPATLKLQEIPHLARPYLAREIALLPSVERHKLLRALPGLGLVPLFSNGPGLEDLGTRAAAMCVFPMTGAGDRVDLGLVFLVQGEKRPQKIGPDCEGNSWTLAAGLCRSLLEVEADPRQRISLAKDWIVTGELDAENRVRWVPLGNKTKAPVSNRIWMLPFDNFNESLKLPPEIQHWKLAYNLKSAHALITGSGFGDVGVPIPWLENVDALHTFVSEAPGPILQAALACGDIPIHLWTSSNEDKSIQPAKILHEFIMQDLDYKQIKPPEQVPDTSIASAQRFLADALEPQLGNGGTVLFSITNGNRLLGLAAYELARLHPDLWLIYKNIDHPDQDTFHFDWVRFLGGQPFTGVMTKDLSSDVLDVPQLSVNFRLGTLEDLRCKFLQKKSEH